ncbi:CRTAC1 family protein [Candidatus Uabimicrobium amorphum]|uniref:RNA-binding protein n=1 Tax=Uabimicrobium amorphum TaxID=2596890 RepID=A0A5S9IW16_UABAM|nr:CRTAC1 family protein [Candidatus Uabimicrobium amorphum]BBM88312.1 RNA-binding protein [Candidatus Uabimicrobium amorphum]
MKRTFFCILIMSVVLWLFVIYTENLAPGTKAMVDKLAQLQNKNTRFSFKHSAISPLQQKISTSSGVKKTLYKVHLARLYLALGEMKKSNILLEKIQALLPQTPSLKKRRFIQKLDYTLIGNYLRLGEFDNCLCNNTQQSCIFPIRGAGIHQQKKGSTKAIELLEKMLTKNENDLAALWLLNLAHMTLGQYPDSVPKKWRISPNLFAGSSFPTKFTNVAKQKKVDVLSKAGGVILDDFDNDGNIDIITSGWGFGEQIRFFVNDGAGTFVERTNQANLTGITGGLNIVQTDYNNDGFLDIFIPRGAWYQENHYPNSLLKNNGDGTFEDVTVEANLLDYSPTQTAAWGDYNNDGWIDLFVGNEARPSRKRFKATHYQSRLYQNNGDGTFSDVSKHVGLDIVAFVKGASWGDVNNDGLLDLYVSCMDEDNYLFINHQQNNRFSFTNMAQEKNVTKPKSGFATWLWDYNNDGWLDIFAASFNGGFLQANTIKPIVHDIAANYLGKEHSLEDICVYKNNGNGSFSEVAQKLKINKAFLTMGANFGDIDNDGFLDVYCGTGNPRYYTLVPNKMMRNKKGKLFEDVTTTSGFGHLQKGHGIAFADIDNDGDQDVYAQLGGAYEGDKFYNALFENPGNHNNWITLRLHGVKSNRAAIGARICIEAANQQGEKAHFYRVVGSGGSFGSSSLQQEIGLGKFTKIERITIDWPIPKVQQVLKNVQVNKRYSLIEGKELTPVDSTPK